jgi:hypothetical protein
MGLNDIRGAEWKLTYKISFSYSGWGSCPREQIHYMGKMK